MRNSQAPRRLRVTLASIVRNFRADRPWWNASTAAFPFSSSQALFGNVQLHGESINFLAELAQQSPGRFKLVSGNLRFQFFELTLNGFVSLGRAENADQYLVAVSAERVAVAFDVLDLMRVVPREYANMLASHLAQNLWRMCGDNELATTKDAGQCRNNFPLPGRVKIQFDLVDEDNAWNLRKVAVRLNELKSAGKIGKQQKKNPLAAGELIDVNVLAV